MDATDVIETYIEDTVRFLPRRERGDVATELRSAGTTSLAAVGHSLGGDVVVGAALAEPRAFDAIGAYEPPMPWLGFRRTPAGSDRRREWAPLAEDPGDEAERFFGRMVSPEAWRRLDATVLHHALAVGVWSIPDTAESIRYDHDARSAVTEAYRHAGIAVPASPFMLTAYLVAGS